MERTSRPFRFLAPVQAVLDQAALTARARQAEDLGFHALVVPDHLIDQLAPIPALAAVAAVTERIRVMPFVLNNDLRHPAVLAQDLASIDVLSGGRLDVAIGAGWNAPEYAAIGLPFDPAAVRQARLAEAIAVLKGAFADDPFTYHGSFYDVTHLDGRPKPVQRLHPPFFIGGGGRSTLELAAREADTVGLAPRVLSGQRVDPRSITREATAEKIGWVREAAGERFAALEFNIYPSVTGPIVTDHARREAAQVADQLRARTGHALTEDQVLRSPSLFIGSVEGFVEKFLELREELGISSIMVGDMEAMAPVVERLIGR